MTNIPESSLAGVNAFSPSAPSGMGDLKGIPLNIAKGQEAVQEIMRQLTQTLQVKSTAAPSNMKEMRPTPPRENKSRFKYFRSSQD